MLSFGHWRITAFWWASPEGAFLLIIDVSISDMDEILGVVSGLFQIMVMICELSVFSTCVPLRVKIYKSRLDYPRDHEDDVWATVHNISSLYFI